jgi:SAM-dependent methyltransferase
MGICAVRADCKYEGWGRTRMHASSMENMWRCYWTYVAGGPSDARSEPLVLDIGSFDVNGTYREVFERPPFRYVGVDMAPGPGVDIVLSDPYRIPFSDGSIDIVISGQAFEHCEFFWRLFDEMVRVLRPDGWIFLIAPSAGGIHRYPVDCYRFYPDAFAALAKHAGAVLIKSWIDELGPWRDLVGVFRRADAPPFEPRSLRQIPYVSGWNGALGTEEEEAVGGGVSYLQVLDRLHRELAPAHYLEIGVRHGASLALARGPATGVDPAPALDRELPSTTEVFALTSDDFFAQHLGETAPDLCFIDGMHLFEYALRDFMNAERCAAPGAIVIIDAIFPNHAVQGQRERRTRAWAGDIWRLVEVLRRYRPDLFLMPLDVCPAGLLLVAGFDPANRVLWDAYNPIVREAGSFVGPSPKVIKRQNAVDPTGPDFHRVIESLRGSRRDHCPPHEVVARLRDACGDAKQGAPSVAINQPKLSVVLVGHNMARELPRTIRSLSPSMQREIDPGDYEVILVDNGSTEAFDEAELRRTMPDLIVHRMPEATVSPVPAINLGLSIARGDLVGVCIDGARMSSPGLLAKALAASRLHPRPVIGTIAFHLGPVPQPENVKRGYNQAVEDELLECSGWEGDGYRLFGISSLAHSSAGGWFELPAESNALFLRTQHWRDLGGWDERFRAPGGGLVNLDTWSRACSDPGGEVIATNNPNAPPAVFHEEYVRIRGRAYERPKRRPLYFGELPDVVKSSLKQSLGRL